MTRRALDKIRGGAGQLDVYGYNEMSWKPGAVAGEAVSGTIVAAAMC